MKYPQNLNNNSKNVNHNFFLFKKNRETGDKEKIVLRVFFSFYFFYLSTGANKLIIDNGASTRPLHSIALQKQQRNTLYIHLPISIKKISTLNE